MINEEEYARRAEELRIQMHREAVASVHQKLAWDNMMRRYLDKAKTPEGIDQIEAMLRQQDRDSVELVKYMQGMIDEIRRLRTSK